MKTDLSPDVVKKLLRRPIAFHRVFVTLTGSVTAALFLSQVLYWQEVCERDSTRDGWWWKTREEWAEETGLSRYEQEGARKILVRLGVLHEKRKGNPAKLWYRVDGGKLANLLAETQLSCEPESSQLLGEKPASSNTEITSETTANLSTPNGVEVGSFAAAHCAHQEIIALYHEILPMCPPVRLWNKTRQSYLQARWREDKQRQSLDWWRKFFTHVAKSKFLTGRATATRDRPTFFASLEWLLRPNNFAKVIEGQYHAPPAGRAATYREFPRDGIATRSYAVGQ